MGFSLVVALRRPSRHLRTASGDAAPSTVSWRPLNRDSFPNTSTYFLRFGRVVNTRDMGPMRLPARQGTRTVGMTGHRYNFLSPASGVWTPGCGVFSSETWISSHRNASHHLPTEAGEARCSRSGACGCYASLPSGPGVRLAPPWDGTM